MSAKSFLLSWCPTLAIWGLFSILDLRDRKWFLPIRTFWLDNFTMSELRGTIFFRQIAMFNSRFHDFHKFSSFFLGLTRAENLVWKLTITSRKFTTFLIRSKHRPMLNLTPSHRFTLGKTKPWERVLLVVFHEWNLTKLFPWSCCFKRIHCLISM